MTQHRSTGQMSTGSGLDTRSDRDSGTVGSPQRSARSRLRWRVLDLVVLAVLAAACGVIFWAWSALVYPLSQAVTVGYPPAGGLLVGGWLMAGPLAALIIRRPGAALACELLAACFEGLLGTHFGMTVVLSGLIQGAAAEAVFLAAGYRRFGPVVAVASGAAAGALGTLTECLIYYYEWPMAHQAVYVVLGTVSGAVIAGLAMWALTRALRSTGVLSGLASGR
ncbi:ECF transporter S component [Kocuria palustris]|uniref:ABC transporter, permease protein n=2 Tax=Kocuria palustris TaxID=71999 RepID=M2YFH7_9MICC|nr:MULTISPECIES: ECF transporter S component [Kocuria]EME37339.1 ABC transporter, permease protein [Kocuria palustris PEL]MCT1835363.1 ECF transporter S component [Kocuria palustris]GLU85578.1 hypothetical protein Kosp01_03240 [Kocuria sp. NBRC 114282]